MSLGLLLALLLGAWSCSTAAAPLHLAPTRSSAYDLEITGLLTGGVTNGFVTREQLRSLRVVTVTNAHDGALKQPTAYTGVYLTDLRAALPVATGSDVIFAVCDDGYAAHFPADYVAAFQPLLILALDGHPAEEWGKSLASGVGMPPFYINSATFTPRESETAAGQKEGARYPYAVSKLVFTTTAKSIGRLGLKSGASATAQAGQKIALRDCLSCHAHDDFGGSNSGRPWLLLKTWSANPGYFRRYVKKPKSVQPAARMPGFPEYDDAALDALTAYFHEFKP
ncbi:MAG TPA: cytochrome c [Candidatus Limnocylindria bacterium]|nr:cytochrome c [Candidatus Limnocylindria bacterium]